MSQASHIEPQWPPRSPHEVLMSTPGGRDRLRRLAERASPSPSPSKRLHTISSARSKAQELLQHDMADDDDEDEETLQLQIQEIQARLKLKKLQKKAQLSSEIDTVSKNSCSGVSRSNSVATSRSLSRAAEARAELLQRSKSQTEISVPVSPIRRAQAPPTQRSPGRVLLGIDKGLRGSDISLKRAPSLRKREDTNSNDRLAGPFLQRTSSQNASHALGARLFPGGGEGEDRPKTFNEKIAAMRSQDVERQERDLRIKRNRSNAFDIDSNQMKTFKENAVLVPEGRRKTPEFSRDEVLNSYAKPSSNFPRSSTAPNLQPAIRSGGDTTDSFSARPALKVPERSRAPKSPVPPAELLESEAVQFESFSSQHLSKRIIPHQVLTRTLSGKKPFLIPELLRVVKGPDFSPPDIEEDLVVMGVIATKSDPRVHQPNSNSKGVQKGKFMIMTLTDLKWELDLFLFGSAFDKFWKLTPGTIIAVLNPQIMPPPRGKEATGKFSLTLNSDADTVLEVGSARDLAFCKSIKKDGKTCSSWVDKRHTEFCDYHVNQQLKKTHSSRMEVNTMNFGKKGGGYGGRRTKDAESKEEAKQTRYDRESHSQIFIGRKSTVNMLDNADVDPDAFHRGSTKEERMTRRILAQEKERDLEKRLGDMGNGIGADYARVRRNDLSQPRPSSNTAMTETPLGATALGLMGGKAADVALSPIKRKRTYTVSSSAAVGWGSNLTKELGKMKDGDNLSIGSRPPMKKKTRFVTEKGIREAGRESLGGDVVGIGMGATAVDDDDDSDDLDIVR